MKATCTDKKNFELTENEEKLGKLTYKNLFSFQAEISLADSTIYKIKPDGFFGTNMIITKDDSEIASLKMNWKGQIIFHFNKGDEYIFKHKGFLNSKYVIENKEGEIVAEYEPEFIWAKLKYNYTIQSNDSAGNPLLFLMGIYACNFYIASASGAIGGGVA